MGKSNYGLPENYDEYIKELGKGCGLPEGYDEYIEELYK